MGNGTRTRLISPYTGSGPNGATITDAFGFHGLAANRATSLLYATIYYLSPFDAPLGFSTWHREQVIGHHDLFASRS
jgi:hypothetical protein